MTRHGPHEGESRNSTWERTNPGPDRWSPARAGDRADSARTVRSNDGSVDCRACSDAGCRPLARITLNGRRGWRPCVKRSPVTSRIDDIEGVVEPLNDLDRRSYDRDLRVATQLHSNLRSST